MLNFNSPYYTKYWKVTGTISLLIIVLAVPAYLLYNAAGKNAMQQNAIEYVGREACIECHQIENDLWVGSHHDLAMDSATDATVLGDFNNATFTHKGVTHRMFIKDGKYYMNTIGETGDYKDYEIAYTFGYTPLQQYLVPFEGGRLQCLPIVWDTENKQWYDMADRVYPNEDLNPDNWLFWTNQAQNWNSMCAECHSTDLQKNYDLKTDSYNTTWSEIDVSCEACHGPASEHIKWAQLPEDSRPMNTNTGLIVQTSNITNEEYVNNCVRCHSRRAYISDYDDTRGDILDIMVPEKAIAPNFYHDGQIKEEDYVYTSFTQSKMYNNGVQCNDCHDVHSTKLKMRGNGLCLQCHQPDIYDTPSHHFHKMPGDNLERLINNTQKPGYEVGEGALCVNCHMDGQIYMGTDYRRDHSFRVPRPDLTMAIGTPNACNSCHTDQSAQWAQGFIKEWYGKNTPPHYGTTFAAAQTGDTNVLDALIQYGLNEVYPLMIRASAVQLLVNYSNEKSFDAVKLALTDRESLVRHSAINSFYSDQIEDYTNYIVPLLQDPVKTVRLNAAGTLLNYPRSSFNTKSLALLDSALVEYKIANEYNADFPSGVYNLGNLYASLNNLKLAEEYYKRAVQIDKELYAAKSNLAMVYNQQGKQTEAETIYRELVVEQPEFHDFKYSLALLLAEKGNLVESEKYMLLAANAMPENHRIWYNLALIETNLGAFTSAEKYYLKAIELSPESFDYLWAITIFYVNQQNLDKTKFYAGLMQRQFPDSPQVNQLMQQLGLN